MIDAIALLRKMGDECEKHAKTARAIAAQAELMDIAAEWHWLAGRATMLHDRIKELGQQSERAA